jgi:outer membrane protein OmpA-like peptidoglycan-associated protein/flagellar hook assembly protein FlgD
MQRKLMFLVKSCKFKTMKNNKIILISIFYLIISVSLCWSTDGRRIKDLYSPYFISGTPNVTNILSPQSESINPASGALTQRITLDLSYIGLIGNEGDNNGLKGHGLNIGNTIPAKVGVFSWSGHYLYSPFASLLSDPTFSLNGSFSKELYPDLLVGAGIKFAGSFEPGVSAMLDLGIISLPGTFGPFKGFSWGIVFQDIGYSNISKAYPSPFSLIAGLSADLVNKNDFKLNASADLGFIGISTFESVQLILGSNLTYKDVLTVSIGSRIDLDSLLNNNLYPLIPSIGISYSFKTNIKEESNFLGIYEKGWNKSEINIQTGIAPITENLWAVGLGVNIPLGLIDKSPPLIELDISGFETEKPPEDSEKLDDTDEEAKPLSKAPFPVFPYKVSSINILNSVSSENEKNINKQTIKIVGTDGSKYKGIFDKRYPESGIASYISPNNDGIKDDLTFPINISDSRYLTGFAFIIRNSHGDVVREIRNKEKRIENQGFSGFFDRLFSKDSGIEIPEEFRWDGFNNDAGPVADGLYYFSVEAWDDNGNIGSSDSYAIVVDTVIPELKLKQPDESKKIFSPNGDGNKDIVRIEQTGSDEDRWEAEIVNSSGEEVKTFFWNNSVPSDIEWDGTDNNGQMIVDGVYSYKIKTLDRAGNSYLSEVNNIVKNTEETPITITIDKSYFSPNNDMILDSLEFTTDVPVKEGLISWNLNIEDKNGKIRRNISGFDNIQDNIVFDGRDSDGIILEEGSYTCIIDVLYKNGNHPDSISPIFNIDVSSPLASVKSSSTIFSPNGDGLKDEIIFYQESSTEINWTGLIKSNDGSIITEFQWLSAAEPSVAWNGTVESGRLASDGDYTYQLIAIDRAGNAGQSDIIDFSLNTEETPVILTTDMEYFSPNSDSIQDNISIIPELKIKEGIESYSLDILDNESKIVRNFSGTNRIPEKFIWNGIRLDGRAADDGIYSSILSVKYKKGDSPTSISPDFIIDTVAPELSLSTEYSLFSPDSDGYKDFFKVSQNTSTEDLWQAEVSSENGTIVNTYFWKGNALNLNWNGKDDEGNTLADGKYLYVLYSSDKAGNYSSASIKNIEVDTRPTAIFLTVSDKYLSPTGNDQFENLEFSTIVNNKTGLDSWSLKMVHENGRIEKEFKGNSGIPKNITWNGLNDSGRIIEGNYNAVFSAIYTKGNQPEVKSSTFTMDVSPPSGFIELSPIPFSPDNDGVDDEIGIKMNVTDSSGIKTWTLEISDPENRAFKMFRGEGTPTEKIIWDGNSSNGELVYAAMDYPVRLILEDILGNTSIYEDDIPIDVLVVKEGDVLKIKIANILFKVNSPDLLADSPEVIEQNKFILKRISELLKKYSTYRITVEGHAVLTRWNDPAAARKEEVNELAPLSEQRAVTVLNYLTKLGVASSRMDSVGKGGKEPLVPHSDLENRWKNRRVEFILWKE